MARLTFMVGKLDTLLREVRACRICAGSLPLGPRPVVRAESSARLLIIGQAPGSRVHASGIPWDDASGDRPQSLDGPGSPRILRREACCHRADGLLLPRAGCQRWRQAAASRVRSAMARTHSWRTPVDRTHPACRALRPGALSPAGRQNLHDGNRRGMARSSPGIHGPAAPVLAQHGMAPAQSLVREGGCSRASPTHCLSGRRAMMSQREIADGVEAEAENDAAGGHPHPA